MFESIAAPLILDVECDGEDHELVWHQGSVVLTNHADVDAELAMVALGGTEPPCITYLRSWNDAIADGGFLAEWVEDTGLTTAWLSWLDMALERMRLEGFHEVLRSLPPARSLRMGEFIHRFPLPWLDRAAAAVAAALTDSAAGSGDGVICSDAADHINAAISVRLRRAFVTSVGGRQMPLGAAALVPLDITIGAAGSPAATGSLVGSGRRVTLTVNPSWLHAVWAADAAIIDGHLVLDLDPTAPHAARVVALAWTEPDRTPEMVEIQVAHDGVAWRLA